MLMVEDFSSNSIQKHPNSLEVLKQTMLSQEDVFREQVGDGYDPNSVHELHRLYDIQKNLMADFDRKQLDEQSFWKGQRQPTFLWLTNPVHHSFLANETKSSMPPMVGSSQSTSKDFWDVNQSVPSRLQPKPWDLKLPADQRFHFACPEKVDLTLSIGGQTMKKDVVKGFRNRKNCKTNSSSFHHVIDLEDSTDEDVKSASTLSSIALVNNNQGSQASVQSNHVSPHCVKDGSESYEERNSSNQAFKEHHGVITPNSVLHKQKPSISQKAFGLDLNISQFDESFSLNDSVTSLSRAGSSGGSVSKIFMQTSPSQSNWREPKVSIFNGTFDSFDQDGAANLTAEASEQNNESALDDDDDVLVQKAAELLLHLSLRSPGTEDSLTKAEPNEEDQPRRSVDSFEAMALKMTEEDDYDVTSKPYETSEFDKKDCGVKLRRGRRLKDFRKDVLPSLSTLASHEIREDLQIMETVIRSREYKRMRSKTVSGGNWFAPVKSKRSRLNYVRRFC